MKEVNDNANVKISWTKKIISLCYLTQNISIKYNVISAIDDTQRCKREKLELIYRLSIKKDSSQHDIKSLALFW